MPTVLITGANRGLGLEFARQYGLDGWRVIATCRNPDSAIKLKNITGDVDILGMDIENHNQVFEVASNLKEVAIDLILNNAGATGPKDVTTSFGDIDVDAWLDLIRLNTISPLKVSEAFINNVKASQWKMIAFISSRSGSITERGTLPHHLRGGNYSYRSSKSALNALAKSLAFDLIPIGIGVLVLHPGWVNSGAGDSNATLDVETSVTGMRKIIAGFTSTQTGSFINYDGESIPW